MYLRFHVNEFLQTQQYFYVNLDQQLLILHAQLYPYCLTHDFLIFNFLFNRDGRGHDAYVPYLCDYALLRVGPHFLNQNQHYDAYHPHLSNDDVRVYAFNA
jgi:hypothetical protein